VKTYAVTHQGLKREENEDRVFIQEWDDRSFLMAVADGMGGEPGGGQAAQIAMEAVKQFTPSLPVHEQDFNNLFAAAEQMMAEEVRRDPNLKGMGTTLTASYIKNGLAFWGHVGDSRLYLFRAGHLIQITEDQTFVNALLKDGVITASEAEVHPMKNILLQCVGCEPLEIATGKFKVEMGDCIFLSTDGLHHELTKEEMISILAMNIELRKKFEILIRAALEAGGRDNISIVGVIIE
jgi:PPM family protein phosphatase